MFVSLAVPAQGSAPFRLSTKAMFTQLTLMHASIAVLAQVFALQAPFLPNN